MSTIELRNKLIDKIEDLNEDYLLEELLSIIELEKERGEVMKIPEEHKAKLNLSLKQLDSGDTVSHDHVIKGFKDGFKN